MKNKHEIARIQNWTEEACQTCHYYSNLVCIVKNRQVTVDAEYVYCESWEEDHDRNAEGL